VLEEQSGVKGVGEKARDASFEEAAADVSHKGRERRTRWYVAYTERCGEARAITNLHRQGFAVFCPWTRKTVRHARKTKTIRAPLFPSYLFVELDPAQDRWRAINGTRGISHLITNGDVPAPVPAGVVEAIMSRCNDAGIVSWKPMLQVGQTVRVSQGSFVDFIGTLEHLSPEGRVRILVELMGRSVAIRMHGEDLEPH